MSSLRLSSSLFLTLLASAAGSTLAALAHAGPPPGLTLGTPIEVAAQHYVTAPGSSPALATNGTDALACWTGVTCVRFTAAGVALDPGGITSTLGWTINGSSAPLVAWDGASYVVIAGYQWQTLDPATGALGPIHTIQQPWNPPGYEIEPQILAFGGGEVISVTDGDTVAEVEIFDESGNGIASFYDADISWTSVGAAWSNGVFLVVWNGEGGVMKAKRIAPDGTLLDATPFNVDAAAAASDAGTTGTAYNTPVVAGSSDGFFVAWLDGRRSSGSFFYNDVYASLVGTDGTVRKGAYAVALNAALNAATWDGARWWAALRSSTGSSEGLAPIAADGTIGTVTPIAGAPTSDSPALAATSATTFAALAGPTAIVVARFTPSGTQLDTPPVPISSYSVPAASPSLAASASGYLVTWSETSPASSWQTQLLAARLGPDGTPQDVPPLVLGSNSTSSVASAGGAYFVVTPVATEAVSVLRIPPSGPPQTTYLIAPAADAGATYISNPSIVCSGDKCLVSWTAGNTSEAAAIIDDQGNLLVPPFAIPSVIATPGPSSFLLTYGTTYPTESGSDVSLQFNGALSTAVTFANDDPVAAAWGVDRYLVVTEAGDVDRLNAAGKLLAPQTAFAGGLPGGTPAVVWDGRAFLATFGSTNALQGQPPAGLEIPGSGAVSIANAFSLFDSPSPTSPLVVSSAPGAALAVALQPMGQTPRLVARAITVVLDTEADGGLDGGDGGGAEDAGLVETADASIAPDGATDAAVSPPDAGGLDASAPDASVVDGATPAPDGGASDAGSEPAAGGSGCGCRTAGGMEPGGAGPIGLAWLGVVVAFARSRRRASAAPDARVNAPRGTSAPRPARGANLTQE